jgi:hypothetical protein
MKFPALLLSALALGIVLMSCSLPRRSEQSIRERILRDTSKGSSYSAVWSYAKTHGWPVTEQSTGLETKNIGLQPARVVGKRVIKAYLGHYRGLPWRMDVECYWAFDESDKLIDVFTVKYADAP